MTFTSENIVLIGSILLFVSIIIGKTGIRFGIPTLLLFLFVGMFFGTDGLGWEFNSEKETQFIGMLALSVILYTGGMDTRFQEIKPVLMPGVVLSTVGVILTTLFTAFFIWGISRFSFILLEVSLGTCLLLAAVMSSTDSASVFGILRSQKMHLKENLRPLLELESGSNDPMAYIITILLVQYLGADKGMTIYSMVLMFFSQLIIGALLGFLLGKITIWILNKIKLENLSLQPILLLSLVFFTFALTDQLQGNGFLAVYIAGIVVGNAKILSYRREINTFMDGLTWLFQIIMFLSLGLLVNPREMLYIAPIATLIGLFLIFFARPLTVWLCLWPFRKFSNRAISFTSWVGLRGAVPIILATYPVVAGIPGSDIIFNIVFFITILSLVIQGMTISKVAHFLHLDLPLPKVMNDFGVELPDEIDSSLADLTVDEALLSNGDTLKEIELPEKTLVMLIKRGERFLIPNGAMHLQLDDKLLLISEGETETAYKKKLADDESSASTPD